MAKPTYAITAVQLDDVAAIGQLVSDAFLQDRQTQMKNLGSKPYDMKAITADSLPGLLHNPRAFAIKVTDENTGAIMGYCNWGCRGFDPADLPELEGKPSSMPEEAHKTAITTISQDDEETEEQQERGNRGPDCDYASPETDPIARLQAVTGNDLEAWMNEVMPNGVKCLYVIGLSVSPTYQGRGVGGALLRWGTDICDRKGVFAWVHSSEPAWQMYEKNGFQVIRTLDVDLDEYAPVPPPDEGPEGIWGHYVFRYMKYLPRCLT